MLLIRLEKNLRFELIIQTIAMISFGFIQWASQHQ
jgi:hypothetical protein